MVSTVTKNRRRKVKLLRDSLEGILDMLMLPYKRRDWLNMKHYKQLKKDVELMLRITGGEFLDKKPYYNFKQNGYKLHTPYKNKPPVSKKTRKKLSSIMTKNWNNPEFRESRLRAIFNGLFPLPTKLEKKMIKIIQKHNLPYKYVGNGDFWIGRANPDFVNINGEKICIEVANKKEKEIKYPNRTWATWQEYEKQRIENFAKYGWKCVVLWENEFKELSRKVKSMLEVVK